MSSSKLQVYSGKTYTHAVGLSCCFRQWRAHSHCAQLHGYALRISFIWRPHDKVDDNGWVVDFGGLKHLKAYLEDMFDHTTLVAEDDPHLNWFRDAMRLQLVDLRVVPATGCENFARMIFEQTQL